MRSINKVILIGNLTRDPELRQTANGQNVTTFGVATNREWMTKEGERKNSAEFHECVSWAKLAEICEQYLTKGNLVYVEGYLKTRSWDTPEGIKKFKTEVVVKDMIRLEKRAKDSLEYIPAEEVETSNEEVPTKEASTETLAEEAPTETPDEEASTEVPAKEASTETPAVETPTEVPTEEASTEETSTENTENQESDSDSTDENPIDKDLGL